MARIRLLVAALAVASCAGDQGDAPFANAPGSEFAPMFSPPPSPRGVAPTILNVSGGMVCGDKRLRGRRIGAIKGSNSACGIANPVRVTEVSGIALKAAIRVDCGAAKALADWTDDVAKPAAIATMDSKLKSMRPVASYACRTRNSRRGARISEHAKGNAVDIAEFSMTDGQNVTVLDGWRGQGSPFLRRIWRGACDHFGTVLGPNADKYHQDHFHFDVARHRGGPYCR